MKLMKQELQNNCGPYIKGLVKKQTDGMNKEKKSSCVIEITKQSQMELLKTNVVKDNNFFNQQINRLNRAEKQRVNLKIDRQELSKLKKKKKWQQGEKELNSKNICDEISGS